MISDVVSATVNPHGAVLLRMQPEK
jgi:hypothetical protein